MKNFSGLAFKIQIDPHVGKLTYVRIYSGKLISGSYAYNSTKDNRSESAGCFLCTPINGKKSKNHMREIVAVVVLKATSTGDTICAPDGPITLEQISFLSRLFH